MREIIFAALGGGLRAGGARTRQEALLERCGRLDGLALVSYDRRGRLGFMSEGAHDFIRNKYLMLEDFRGRDTLLAAVQRCKAVEEPQARAILDTVMPSAREQNFLFKGVLVLGGEYYACLAEDMGRTGTAVIFKNVSDHCRREIHLKGLEERLAMLSRTLKATPQGVIVCSGQAGRKSVVYVNDHFAEMVSARVPDLLMLSFPDVLMRHCKSPDIQKKLENVFIAHQPQSIDFEKIHDGLTQWYRIDVVPSLNVPDAPDLFIGILEDQTEARIKEAQLFQGQKLEALGQLAGGVAHDFNNILSIVDGYARIARKELGDRPEISAYLDRIAESVRRGAALTHQLLTFGRHSVVIEKVADLGRLVREQEALLRPLLDASINLLVQAEDGVYAECAPDAVGQILINLVVNARDAMPHGGNLIVEVRRCENAALPFQKENPEQEYSCLRVIDSGIGMDAETRRRIFDPFFTTKEQGKGTGLGLSVVYGLVRQMGGNIHVTSAPGEGTAMSIYLPLTDKKPVRKLVETGADGGAVSLKGYTVLIAEDEPDLLRLLSGMLEDMGMTVIAARNGNDALLKQEDYKEHIDFLLTDVVMPELNGVRLADLFATVRPETKIVFMSGYPANGQMARIEIPEGARLLPKPIEYEKLGAILKGVAQDDQSPGQREIEKMAGRWKSASAH